MVAPVEPRSLPVPVPAAPAAIAAPPATLPRLVIAGAALVGALLLIGLAVPRLSAAIELASAKPIYDKLQAGDTAVDDATLEATIARLTKGFAQSSEPHLGVMLAYVHMVHAERTTNRALADARLLQAAEAARATIRVSPSNLVAWVLLTMALDSRDPRDPATLAALARSIHVAPYDPRMMGYRISLAMRHWARLDEPSRKLASFQIKRIGELNLRYLAELTRDSFGLPAVHEAYRDKPALKARFDAVYLALPQ